MANHEHVALIHKGVLEWNHQRAKLNRAKLDAGAADLSGADLSGANLSGANLSGANLIVADLRGANLNEADLSEAYLSWADLSGADLTGANLDRTTIWETTFGDTQLKDAKGLDTCIHSGPSTIDHRTLERSGPLPKLFLRGCGLPDTLIEYLPSLMNRAIQFYSCFISYSTADQAFADRLHADLQNKGVRCWFAPHKMKAGEKIYEQIDEAIRVYDRLLLILSEESMRSNWVQTEIFKASNRERREARRMLFPISLTGFETVRDWECFDADTGKDAAREIREYFIPDFSNWKDHDSYMQALDRLIRDLETPPDKK